MSQFVRHTKKSGNRRRRRTTSAHYVLEVTTRSKWAQQRRRQMWAGWAVRLFLVAALAVGAYFGARTIFDRFFFSNPEYTLRHIDLELDGIMTRAEFLEKTGLQEGINLFVVDLPALEKSLRAESMTSQVNIQRVLPDRLTVRLRSHVPVAWVAAEGETGDPSASPHALMVNAQGLLLKPRHLHPQFLSLPAIYGVKDDNIRQGEPLDCEDLRMALQLLAENAARPDSLLRIRSLDVSHGYRIDVLNDQNARIIFANSDFAPQLDRLQQLLLHCAETGRTLDTVNLMVKRNTPVTFVMATASAGPAPGSPSPEPKPHRKPTKKN